MSRETNPELTQLPSETNTDTWEYLPREQKKSRIIVVDGYIPSESCVRAKPLQSCPTRCDPLWTVAHKAPLSVGFSRQEYWSRLPFPSSGESPQPRDQTCFSCISCIGWPFLYHYHLLRSPINSNSTKEFIVAPSAPS